MRKVSGAVLCSHIKKVFCSGHLEEVAEQVLLIVERTKVLSRLHWRSEDIGNYDHRVSFRKDVR